MNQRIPSPSRRFPRKEEARPLGKREKLMRTYACAAEHLTRHAPLYAGGLVAAAGTTCGAWPMSIGAGALLVGGLIDALKGGRLSVFAGCAALSLALCLGGFQQIAAIRTHNETERQLILDKAGNFMLSVLNAKKSEITSTVVLRDPWRWGAKTATIKTQIRVAEDKGDVQVFVIAPAGMPAARRTYGASALTNRWFLLDERPAR